MENRGNVSDPLFKSYLLFATKRSVLVNKRTRASSVDSFDSRTLLVRELIGGRNAVPLSVERGQLSWSNSLLLMFNKSTIWPFLLPSL